MGKKPQFSQGFAAEIKANSSAGLRIDHKKFGDLVTKWLNENSRQFEFLAKEVKLSERGSSEKIVEQISSGNKAEASDIYAIAAYCGLEVPYADKAPPTRSPFG